MLTICSRLLLRDSWARAMLIRTIERHHKQPKIMDGEMEIPSVRRYVPIELLLQYVQALTL